MTAKQCMEVDWISGLPEPILHHIISFLGVGDAVQFSLVSKTFRSAWKSRPIIDFDCELFEESTVFKQMTRKRRVQLFWNSVYASVMQRMESGFDVEELRVSSTRSNFLKDILVEYLLQLQPSYNVEVPQLDANCEKEKIGPGNLNGLPSYIFFLKSIRVLKLDHLNFKPLRKLVFSQTSIEDLSLSNCVGLPTIYFKGSSLRNIMLEDCFHLKKINVEAPNLVCFELDTVHLRPLDSLCEVKFKGCKFLRVVKLKEIYVTNELLEQIASQCPLLDLLELKGPSIPWDLTITSTSLRTLLLDEFGPVNKVQIFAPSLRYFVLSFVERWPCEIDLSACRLLQTLELSNVEVQGEWVKEIKSVLPWLVTVKLA